MTAALLFDLDGTLADTDAEHIESFQRVFGDLGVTFDHHAYTTRIMGWSTAAIAANFLPHLPVAEGLTELARKEALYRELLVSVRPIGGLMGLLDQADALGLPMGVVTNAPRLNAEAVLDGLGIAHRFRILVIGDELARSKPDPLPYLTGVERLGADPNRTLAFEDSRSGVAAAVAAGLTTIGIMTALDETALLSAGAHIAVKDFSDPRVAALVQERTRISEGRE